MKGEALKGIGRAVGFTLNSLPLKVYNSIARETALWVGGRIQHPASSLQHRVGGWDSGRKIACTQCFPVLSSLSHCLSAEVCSL
jgi:hypothetical protein